ncbi:MAG: tRNA pseudouridine(38-40) synthase TruA [Chloroflexi bacterium]|nr:tRNA pseudouridine(38-40) synthase TruA [Chloroflexota bacterium]
MRYALLVEYDGTAFHGSQVQKGVRTVQGELEGALERIYESPVRLRLGSRTDAGVHATGQVAVFDGEQRHETATLRDALNFYVPKDVAVRDVESVADEFDPRRCALQRKYVFTLNDGAAPSPINRWTEVRTRRHLAIDEMNLAGARFIGSHDFASFAGPATPPDAVTVRNVSYVNVERGEDAKVRVKINGNAFIHQQVRRMAGALVRVGTGKLSHLELATLVDQPRRGAAGWPLGPQGLCLTRIEYGKDGPFQGETEYN